MIFLVFGICDLVFFNCMILRQNGIVSFPIKLAAFQASGAADTRNLSKIPSEAKRQRGTLLVNVITHITPSEWTKAGPYEPGSLLLQPLLQAASLISTFSSSVSTTVLAMRLA